MATSQNCVAAGYDYAIAGEGVDDGRVVDCAFGLDGASVLKTSDKVKMFIAVFWLLQGCI